MKTLGLLLVAGSLAVVQGVAAQTAAAQSAQALAQLRAACATDAQQLCAGVQSGGGRIIECLKAHKDQLTAGCKQAAAAAAGQGGGQGGAQGAGAGGSQSGGQMPPSSDNTPLPPPAPAANANGGGAAAGAATRPAHATAATPTKAGAPGAYLLMKQVDVVDPGVQGEYAEQTAYRLLVPSTWTFKGTISFGGSKSGCFADLLGLSMEGKSADGTLVFQGAPDYGWQYAEDPQILHKLNDPARRALGIRGTPCPVTQPVTAEAYFRKNIATLYPADSTVVSVEPFPELNAIARRRLGLPPDGSGNKGNAGGARTEAIRARIDYQRDGKPVEEWVALAVVTRVFQVGRGRFYDCQATDLRAMRAPKGKLDENDRLFKAMVSSVEPVPKWQSASNALITKFYRAEAQKEAIQDQIIANLQNQVAATINGVTANMMQGADNSAFAADQNIRGVQTFRDPSTGGTMELSNQYDHAWLNGANEYVMSDDPNFNPNGHVSGNWSQLQPVRPAP